MRPRLYEKYINEVRPALQEKRKYQNVHQVPRMEKIVVNMGVSASLEKGAVDDAAKDLAMITIWADIYPGAKVFEAGTGSGACAGVAPVWSRVLSAVTSRRVAPSA